MNKLLLISVFVVSITFTFGQQSTKAQGGRFRASVVKIDITPADSQMLAGYAARKSTGVNDRIFHRIVALDDGKTQFFLVSTEIGKMSPSQYDRVAAQLKKKLGIDPQNFWWSVTHTHSAPEVGPPGLSGIFLPERYLHPVANEYTTLTEQKLIEGIIEARQKLAPARLGVGWGFSEANINRRAVDIDGKASLGLNPDGPVDHRIGILRIDKEDGTPLVLIANYPMHGTVLGGANLKISGDAPGIVADYVEKKTGVPLLFINGAAGNLAPIYSVYPNPRSGHLGEFRVLLGDKILEANSMISTTTNEVTLSSDAFTVETPRKTGMEWPSDLGNYTRTTKTGEKIVRLPVRILKINDDVAIWSAPLELFCEISNEIRDRSPFTYTFYFGYSNGNLGYLLPESEYKYGGYEPSVSPFTPAAARHLTESVITWLKGKIQISKANSVPTFRASVVKIDITPADSQMLLGYQARKSTGVLDHIYHRIIVLDDGTTQFFLVSSDICEFSPSQYDRIAALLKQQLGINPLNLWWATTHTHSAPELGPPGLAAAFLGDRYKHVFDADYQALVERTMIEGIKEGLQNLTPARLGIGWGFAQANINRRAIDIDGKASLGLNPNGPVDRRIGLLRLDKEDGTPLALIANYPMHGTVLSQANLKISGDAPGIVAEYVEQKLGVPLVFINGAMGNLAPIYSVYPDSKSGHLGQFRVLLGDKILDANRMISATTNEVKLITGALTIETPRKAGMDWTSDLGDYTRTTKAGNKMVKLPIRFLKINENVAIWSAPLELFCEISNEIRDRSPFPFTFYFGLTNGWLGYMLPESEFKHGGYEPDVSPYTPSAARYLTESVVSYLKGEMLSLHPVK